MVDLRKWFPALAVVAIAIGGASTAEAQLNPNPPFTCAVSANPSTVRQEGFTELAGDVVIDCTGGTPTPAGAFVPRVNVTVTANTNITSRFYDSTRRDNEALLSIDDPRPEAQRACLVANNGGSTGCGTPFTGVYTGSLNPGANGLIYNYDNGTGNPNTINGQSSQPTMPNIWQAEYVQNAGTTFGNSTTIIWRNVPIDPPGTNANRRVRLTNIRVDATQIGVGLIPTPIQLTLQINPPTGVPINPPTNAVVTVAFVARGLTATAGSATTFRQCEPPTANNVFNITFTEGFPSAFRNRFIDAGFIDNPQGPPRFEQQQRFFNSFYFTESGFFKNDGSMVSVGGSDNRFNRAQDGIGLANQGTRLAVRIPTLPAGVSFTVRNAIRAGQLIARLVTGTDSAGAGGTFTTATIPATTGVSTETTTVTTGLVVYEIVGHDPFTFEALTVPMTVSYSSFPALGSSTVQAGFAPFYAPSVGRAPSNTAPHPRFVDNVISGLAFQIVACRTHILFPFVSNQIGFDTGLAISNTSLDTGVFDTTPQDGACRLYFYGSTSGGGAPPAFLQSGTVVAGRQLLYILSSGGNLGLTGVPNFQGYIIAVCEFQYGHGFAYITDNFGGTPRTAEGYLALILDEPMAPSTRRNARWSISEVLGH
jgi:hypothetical protein